MIKFRPKLEKDQDIQNFNKVSHSSPGASVIVNTLIGGASGFATSLGAEIGLRAIIYNNTFAGAVQNIPWVNGMTANILVESAACATNELCHEAFEKLIGLAGDPVPLILPIAGLIIAGGLTLATQRIISAVGNRIENNNINNL